MAVALLKNFASLVGAEAFSKLVTFAAFAYLARVFGPAGFGFIEWAATVLMCSSLIVDQGFSTYGAREIAKSPQNTRRLVSEIVTARFLLACFSYALIAALVVWFVREGDTARLLLIYGLSLFALPFLLHWVFQGHDRMYSVGVIQTVRQLVFAAAVFLSVRAAGDFVWVGIAEVASVGISAVLSVILYRRFVGSGKWVKPFVSGKLFREGTPIGLSQMFWVVKMFGATFIVGLVATAEDTGYFAGAMRIYIALHTFVWLYYFNMLPSMSRAWERGREEFERLIRRSIRLVVPASLAVGLLWITVSSFMMSIAYGESFLPGESALQWLAGACVAAAISGHYRYGLIASGNQNSEMLVAALGSITAVALIPAGYLVAGAAGAAAALLAAEVVVLFASWLIARRGILGKHAGGPAAGETPLQNYTRCQSEAAR